MVDPLKFQLLCYTLSPLQSSVRACMLTIRWYCAFLYKCLDLQAFLHVQSLEFQHISAYSLC